MKLKSATCTAIAITFLGIGAPAAVSDDDLESAIQNPYLRERFKERELDIVIGPLGQRRRWNRPPWERDTYDFMLERRIDQLLRLYLKDVIEKREALRSTMEEVETAASELRDAPQSEAWVAASRLRKSMDRLADRADDLRSSLASVISELPEKTDFKPEIKANAKLIGFPAETEFLRRHVDNALRRVDEFFFQPGNTVSLVELQGDDMMVALYKVEKMAEKVKDLL